MTNQNTYKKGIVYLIDCQFSFRLQGLNENANPDLSMFLNNLSICRYLKEPTFSLD